MDVEEVMSAIKSRECSDDVLVTLYGYQVQLYAFFGDHQSCADLAIEHGNLMLTAMPSFVIAAIAPFYMAISLCHVARSSKQRKYRRQARKMYSIIKGYVRNGNPNVRHHMTMIEAELTVVQGDFHLASAKYESAGIVAARSGFIHDAALVNERYGEFLLEYMSNRVDGAYRLDQAIKFWLEWGAQRKVDILRQEHSHLWQTPSEICVGAIGIENPL